MEKVTYGTYLGLSELLSLGQPVTPEHDPRMRAAEQFFIVAHQTSELWLRQVLVDINQAILLLAGPDRDVEQATEQVARAAGITRLLVEHVEILERLQPQDFAEFRGRLGTASGAQSSQFHQLRRLLGLCGVTSPLSRELLAVVAERSTTLPAVYWEAPRSGSLYRLAESMTELSRAFWQWQLVHVNVVLGAIGNGNGTAGTAGVDYLLSRFAVPFPELWQARAELYASPGTDSHDPQMDTGANRGA